MPPRRSPRTRRARGSSDPVEEMGQDRRIEPRAEEDADDRRHRRTHDPGAAIGARTSAASVQAVIAPSIQGSGRLSWRTAIRPRCREASASAKRVYRKAARRQRAGAVAKVSEEAAHGGPGPIR